MLDITPTRVVYSSCLLDCMDPPGMVIWDSDSGNNSIDGFGGYGVVCVCVCR